jgi:hypothetical protein
MTLGRRSANDPQRDINGAAEQATAANFDATPSVAATETVGATGGPGGGESTAPRQHVDAEAIPDLGGVLIQRHKCDPEAIRVLID